MATNSPRPLWKRFQDNLKKGDYDAKRFRDDFGGSLEEVEDILEKNRDRLKASIDKSQKIADRYHKVIDEISREPGQESKRKAFDELRDNLKDLCSWLDAQEKQHLK